MSLLFFLTMLPFPTSLSFSLTALRRVKAVVGSHLCTRRGEEHKKKKHEEEEERRECQLRSFVRIWGGGRERRGVEGST